MEATEAHRLVRRRDDRIIGGVAGGIADHFGIDVTLVRIAFVVLTIFGGAGVLLYVVAWAMLPEEGQQHGYADSVLRRGRWQPILGLVLIAIAVTSVSSRLWHGGDVGLPIFLIGLGAFLVFFKPPERRDDEPVVAYRPSAPMDAPTAPSAPPAPSAAMPPPPTTTPQPPRPSRRRRKPRGRSLTIPTLGVLAIGAGAVGLVLAAGGTVDATRVLAGGLIAIGITLVVATRYGRAGGLVPVGVVLLAALSLTAALKIPFEGGVGDRTYRPTTAAEVKDEYHLAIGELHLDLRGFPVPSGTTQHFTATVGIGHLLLEVPKDVEVVLHGRAELGDLRVLGQDDGGWKVEQDHVLHQGQEGHGRIEIDAHVGVGQVEVRDA